MWMGAQKPPRIGNPPTRIKQCLNFTSNHHLHHKRSVVRTLLQRAAHLVIEEEDREMVVHVQNALLANGYKRWMFKIPSRPNTTRYKNNASGSTRSITVGLPYVSGLSEHLSRVFRAQGISAYHKPYDTLRSLLVQYYIQKTRHPLRRRQAWCTTSHATAVWGTT